MNKSAIVYLLNNNQKDISNFRHSISLLYDNYYKSFPCDIICFYEKDFPEEELEYLKNALSILKVSFVNIDFEIPNFYSQETLQSIPQYYPHPDFPQANGFSIGYRHMCRFFAGAMFHHPLILQYKYLWRLDTDSFIVSPICYNIFDKLEQNNCLYGYINIQHDHPGVIKNLWEISEEYFRKLNKCNIFENPQIKFHKNRVFYTNFEVFNVEWFAGNDYKNYFDFIDESAGVYKYRWGDHSIRYIALNSLLDEKQLYFYDDIHYFHQKEYLNNRIMDTFNAN
jgi:hypothetical protein